MASETFQTSESEDDFEQLLQNQFVGLTKLLLRASSLGSNHDPSLIDSHLHDRSVRQVQDGLSSTLEKMKQIRSLSMNGRILAYGKLSAILVAELEHAIFSDDKIRLGITLENQKKSREVSQAREQSMSTALARQTQHTQMLEQKLGDATAMSRNLEKSNAVVLQELSKTSQSLIELHQQSVELRMQGLDYKSRVDSACESITQSIKQRLGFVPSDIKKEVLKLKKMKAIGDPKYAEFRKIDKKYRRGARRGRSTTRVSGSLNQHMVRSTSLSRSRQRSPRIYKPSSQANFDNSTRTSEDGVHGGNRLFLDTTTARKIQTESPENKENVDWYGDSNNDSSTVAVNNKSRNSSLSGLKGDTSASAITELSLRGTDPRDSPAVKQRTPHGSIKNRKKHEPANLRVASAARTSRDDLSDDPNIQWLKDVMRSETLSLTGNMYSQSIINEVSSKREARSGEYEHGDIRHSAISNHQRNPVSGEPPQEYFRLLSRETDDTEDSKDSGKDKSVGRERTYSSYTHDFDGENVESEDDHSEESVGSSERSDESGSSEEHQYLPRSRALSVTVSTAAGAAVEVAATGKRLERETAAEVKNTAGGGSVSPASSATADSSIVRGRVLRDRHGDSLVKLSSSHHSENHRPQKQQQQQQQQQHSIHKLMQAIDRDTKAAVYPYSLLYTDSSSAEESRAFQRNSSSTPASTFSFSSSSSFSPSSSPANSHRRRQRNRQHSERSHTESNQGVVKRENSRGRRRSHSPSYAATVNEATRSVRRHRSRSPSVSQSPLVSDREQQQQSDATFGRNMRTGSNSVSGIATISPSTRRGRHQRSDLHSSEGSRCHSSSVDHKSPSESPMDRRHLHDPHPRGARSNASRNTASSASIVTYTHQMLQASDRRGVENTGSGSLIDLLPTAVRERYYGYSV